MKTRLIGFYMPLFLTFAVVNASEAPNLPDAFDASVIDLIEQETSEVTTDDRSIICIKCDNSFEDFLHAISWYESSHNYKAVNTLGYLGKYQFSKKTLKSLGYKVSKKEFLNNPQLQEAAMLSLLRHNRYILRHTIKQFDGQDYQNTIITESGILAAAHLAGAGNVRKLLIKGKDFKDGYGTKMSSYLFTFSGYELALL